MNRLVDYFVILGFDNQKQGGTYGTGKVLQRFPEHDWPDVPFIDGLELFCQPQGWKLSSNQQKPSFFISVLTDIDANKHYCACLSFYEPISIQSFKQPDEEDIELDTSILLDNSNIPLSECSSNQATMYAPKCLVLVSRHHFVGVFKCCLGTIYTVYFEGMEISMETLVTNLLCIEVPAPGVQIKISIGANDNQSLTMPLSSTVPVTGTTVAQLFERLGIHSVMNLFTAVMTDHKILFQSKSYSLLHESCHALTSLMYPFVYSHVYIPLLPSSLLEVLSSPTPFIMGVHSSLRNEVEDLLDVIVVDLDGGNVHIPDCIHLPRLDEPAYNEMVDQLCSVITPQLMHKDDAFVSSHLKPSSPSLLDKEIRAIFLRLFTQMLQGYRTCLQIVRIHPKPFITFYKAAFLGKRNLVENEFVVRLLESMFFNSFVQARGTPYRPSDLFDELYATMHDTLKREMKDPELIIRDIKDLAHQLYLNENPQPRESSPVKVSQPSEGAFTRVHPKFPALNSEVITENLENERIKREMMDLTKPCPAIISEARIIATGPPITLPSNSDSALFTNSARRLEVMRNCINCIFEGKIQDARKSFPAVLRALQNKSERLALAKELADHVSGNKCVLSHEQFDLVVRLMNSALQQDCDYLDGSTSGLRMRGLGDVNGLAATVLPLSMTFCRRLCTGVIQFAYTCLQEHLIWDNLGFWESTFYQNVEQEIVSLYGSEDSTQLTPLDIAAEQIRLSPKLADEHIKRYSSSEESTVYSQAVDFVHRIVYFKIPLDIAYHHERNTRNAKLNTSLTDGNQPTNTTGQSDTNSNITAPAAGGGAGGAVATGRESFRDERDHEKDTRELDNESGFEEGSNGRGQSTGSEISVNVIKFVGRFVDKVCTDGGVTEEHVKALHQMIPGILFMHCETLDAIYKESKKIPPVTKPKIITPNLLAGEELAMRGLRAYLIPDGRDEVLGTCINGSSASIIPQPIGGPALLPAEGAIFLTNYRVIFRGRPCDQYASENVVVRSFPLSTLVKEKKVNISSKYLIETIDQCISEGLQLRSNIFELVKIAFDEEVSSEDIETLRKMINKARAPPNVFHYFAFSSQQTVFNQINLLNLQKQKEKKSTFKGMAKKTLMRSAHMAGIQIKSKSKKNKYALSNIMGNHLGSKTLAPKASRQSSVIDSMDDQSVSDNLSLHSDSSHVHSALTLPSNVVSSNISSSSVGVHHLSPVNTKDSRTLKKLTELSYVKDYHRNGLGSYKDILQPPSSGMMSPTSSKIFRSDGFRISLVNCSYNVSQSYPAFIAVPSCVSDDSLQRLGRHYKNGRFPAIVWRHPKTKGLLIRASSFHGKGVIGILKGHGAGAGGTNSANCNMNSHSSNSVPTGNTESSSNVDQEKYFQAIVNLTPHISYNPNYQGVDTSLSISSLAPSKYNIDHNSAASSSSSSSPQQSHPRNVVPTTKDPKKANVLASFNRAMNTIRYSGGKPSFGSIGSSVSKQLSRLNASSNKMLENLDPENCNSASSGHHNTPSNPVISSLSTRKASTISSEGQTNSPLNSHTRKSLYVLGEKSQAKNLRSDLLPSNIEFIPIECHEVRSVKQSFKKLMKACCPSSALTDPEQSFMKQVENSEWLNQLLTIMRISSAIIDLIDLQGSSVMLCLEDDMDIVPQIVSVAELCLDPYYRTFEGFRVLVEKEWLAYGHRFSHRCNHTAATIGSGFAPLFLQFLDIVHQIMHQFPLAFQFNDYFLRFVAYHYVSCRFRTFLLDSESERAKYGWPLEDILRNYQDSMDDGYDCDIDEDFTMNDGGSNGRSSNNGTLTCHSVNGNVVGYINIKSSSFWDYAERMWNRSPIFYNFYYIPTNHNFSEANVCVIRPYCNISNLKIWDYYLNEQLNHGPSYDFEVVQMEKQRQEEMEATADKDRSKRSILDSSYDCIAHFQPSYFEEMLERIQNMEMELGKSASHEKWHNIWDRLDIPVIFSANTPKPTSSDLISRQGSIKSQILGRYCTVQQQIHKKNTLDLRKLFPKRKHKHNPKISNDIYLQ